MLYDKDHFSFAIDFGNETYNTDLSDTLIFELRSIDRDDLTQIVMGPGVIGDFSYAINSVNYVYGEDSAAKLAYENALEIFNNAISGLDAAARQVNSRYKE